MSLIRKGICALLALSCLIPLTVRADRPEDQPEPYIRRMVAVYQQDPEGSQQDVEALLRHISRLDPETGELWQQIMESWHHCRREMPIFHNVLPDGLPEDSSLCIVVLGFGLRDDGTMKPELIARLETALHSAEKYPNAYIAVTGGGTARYADTTEAAEMALWLRERGVAYERVILEDRSISTPENAMFTTKILLEEYPEVTALAVVTSDYHVEWGSVLFETAALKAAAQGHRKLELLSNAANLTTTDTNTIGYQAWGICEIMGIQAP